MCSGPLARVVASDCTINIIFSRTAASSPIGSPSVAKSTRTVNFELKSAMNLTLHEIVRLLFSFFNELQLQGI